MSYFRFVLIACAFLLGSLWAADPDGAALYQARCSACHDNGGAETRAPKREQIAVRKPEAIVGAMFDGAMIAQASGLTLDDGRAIARFITGKDFSAVAIVSMGKCDAPGKKFSLASGDWNGWSVEPDNSRYQAKPRLSAADIPRLKLKWAFGFPGDSRAYAQPAVVGGRVFVGSAGGKVYSLDASTGCTYWSFKADGAVRTAITIGRSKAGGRYIAYFADLRGTAYAVDASSGALIWKVNLDNHPYARITGSPIFYEGRLLVPMASFEEASGIAPGYECCTFRGSRAALDAETGRQFWKSYTVLDPPKAFKKNKNGGQMYGPAGAGVWSAPTIDAKRKLVYVATGDSYTDVELDTSDAILAFRIDNGSLVWVSQVTAHAANLAVGSLLVTRSSAQQGLLPLQNSGLDHLSLTVPDSLQAATFYGRIFDPQIFRERTGVQRYYLRLGAAYIALGPQANVAPYIDHIAAGVISFVEAHRQC